MSNPAAIRHEREKRLAVRAALARPPLRLDPKQLKLALSAHDGLFAKSNALSAEAEKVAARPEIGMEDRVFTDALRRLDQLTKQSEPLDARARALRAHPQVIAALAAREKKEERGQ